MSTASVRGWDRVGPFAAQLQALAGRGFKRYPLHIPDDPQDAPAMRLYARFGRLPDAQHVLRASF